MKGSLVAYFSDAKYTGGAEKYLCLLASAIDRERYRPVLVMNQNPGLDAMKAWMEQERIPVYEVALRMPYTFKGAGSFVMLLRRLKPSLLHMNLPGPFDSQFGLVAPLASLAGVKYIVATEHLPMVPSFTKGRILKSFSARWIDRVITVSNDNKIHLVREHRIPESKVRVVHVGIPDPGPQEPISIRGSLSLESDTYLLVIVGALHERKGHGTVMDAMVKLPSRIHLVVVGVGEREAAYRLRASGLGIGSRVHFLGARDDVAAILCEADLMVLPSQIDATPYVIVEAMAAGLPVVASNVYGIPELVADGVTGLLVPPGDSDALAQAIMTLEKDSGRMRAMASAARSRFEERFKIEASVSKTIEVYTELMGNRG